MSEYTDYLRSFLFFGFLSIVFLRIAKSFGFFHLRESSGRKGPLLVPLHVVLVNFALYLGITTLVAPACAWLIDSFYMANLHNPPPDTLFGSLQVAFLALIFVLFYLFSRSHHHSLFPALWKQRSPAHSSSIGYDMFVGAMTWVIAFPLVACIGQLLDLGLSVFLHFEGYEQVAVRYLKTTVDSPPLLTMALFTILIAAPCIEEFLFRGCLQSFLRQHLPFKSALVLSSAGFALFHFSLSQGLGNISLCASLFIFALFLGFIYEKQKSLFASVALHMTFNLISTGRVLLFPE